MKFFIVLALVGLAAAQTTVLPIRRVVVNDGRYRGYDDGRYRPDGSGRYSGDNGKYVHDGRPYVHIEPEHVEKPQPQVIYIQSTQAPTTVYVKPTTLATRPPTTTTTTPSPTTTTPAPTTKKPVPKTTVAPVTVIQYIPKPTQQVEYVGYPYDRQYNYNQEGGWKIFRHLKEANQEGYNYAYETENKILGQESGRLLNYKTGVDGEYGYGGMKTNGFYEYVGDNGVVYRVDYLADENGFQPVGVHLPREWVETLSTY